VPEKAKARDKLHFLLGFMEVNVPSSSTGITLLSEAITRRDEALAKLLCEHGADPHVRSKISVKSQVKLSALEQIKKEEEVDESVAGNGRWAKAQKKFEESRKRLAAIKGLVEMRAKELQKTKHEVAQ
jgi:ankyrin repeat protein